MILGPLLAKKLSPCEEKLLAVAFVSDLPLIGTRFVGPSLTDAWIEMNRLPPAWVRELSMCVLTGPETVPESSSEDRYVAAS